MARRSKSVSLGQEDIIFAVGGALGGLALNGVLNQVLANQPENTRNTLAKAIPAVKLIGGGFLAMNSKMDRKLRFAGIGMAATGGIELGSQFAPDYFGIGSSGDVFSLVAGTDVLALPIVPSANLETEFSVMGSGSGYDLESETAVL